MIRSIIAFTLVTVLSVIAQADQKVFPGAFCKEAYDTSPEVYYDSNGGAKNNTSSTQWFMCPLVRDLPNQDVEKWRFTARRGSSGEGWTVTLWSTNLHGTSGYYSNLAIANGLTNTYDTSGYSSSLSSWVQYGMLYVSSNMPAYSTLVRIELWEGN